MTESDFAALARFGLTREDLTPPKENGSSRRGMRELDDLRRRVSENNDVESFQVRSGLASSSPSEKLASTVLRHYDPISNFPLARSRFDDVLNEHIHAAFSRGNELRDFKSLLGRRMQRGRYTNDGYAVPGVIDELRRQLSDGAQPLRLQVVAGSRSIAPCGRNRGYRGPQQCADHGKDCKPPRFTHVRTISRKGTRDEG